MTAKEYAALDESIAAWHRPARPWTPEELLDHAAERLKQRYVHGLLTIDELEAALDEAVQPGRKPAAPPENASNRTC